MLVVKSSHLGTRDGSPEGEKLLNMLPTDRLPNGQQPDSATEENVDTATMQHMHKPLNIFPETGGDSVSCKTCNITCLWNQC